MRLAQVSNAVLSIHKNPRQKQKLKPRVLFMAKVSQVSAMNNLKVGENNLK